MEKPVDVFISHHTSTCLPVTQAICHSLECSGQRINQKLSIPENQ